MLDAGLTKPKRTRTPEGAADAAPPYCDDGALKGGAPLD